MAETKIQPCPYTPFPLSEPPDHNNYAGGNPIVKVFQPIVVTFRPKI